MRGFFFIFGLDPFFSQSYYSFGFDCLKTRSHDSFEISLFFSSNISTVSTFIGAHLALRLDQHWFFKGWNSSIIWIYLTGWMKTWLKYTRSFEEFFDFSFVVEVHWNNKRYNTRFARVFMRQCRSNGSCSMTVKWEFTFFTWHGYPMKKRRRCVLERPFNDFIWDFLIFKRHQRCQQEKLLKNTWAASFWQTENIIVRWWKTWVVSPVLNPNLNSL